MNIGIYGDSFAGVMIPEVETSWVDHLKKEFNVTNYAVCGSSLVHAYENFLNNNMKHDINIVMITTYGRLWLPNLKEAYCGIAGMTALEHYLEHCTYEPDLEILRAARDYYICVEYEPHQKLMHKAMIKDLQRHENTILIPCFNADWSLVENTTTYMDLISQIDLRYYGKVDQHGHPKQPVHEKRSCHMNDSNNLIFANKMKEYLLGDRSEPFKINLDDYVEPIGEPYEKYFFD